MGADRCTGNEFGLASGDRLFHFAVYRVGPFNGILSNDLPRRWSWSAQPALLFDRVHLWQPRGAWLACMVLVAWIGGV